MLLVKIIEKIVVRRIDIFLEEKAIQMIAKRKKMKKIRFGSCKVSASFVVIATSKELKTNITNGASSITFILNIISWSFGYFLHLFDLNIVIRFIVIIITMSSIHLNFHSLCMD